MRAARAGVRQVPELVDRVELSALAVGEYIEKNAHPGAGPYRLTENGQYRLYENGWVQNTKTGKWSNPDPGYVKDVSVTTFAVAMPAMGAVEGVVTGDPLQFLPLGRLKKAGKLKKSVPKVRSPGSPAQAFRKNTSKFLDGPERKVLKAPRQGHFHRPQGFTRKMFQNMSARLRKSERIKELEKGLEDGLDIRVHGSRASKTAKPDSDVDIAVRVSPRDFDKLMAKAWKNKPNPGSAKEKTMQHCQEVGKITAGRNRPKLSQLAAQLKEELGMDVQISVIRKGGPFDKGPWVKVP